MTEGASLERLLPQNVEAECGVLGSIIIDPEALLQVVDFLHAEDFYRDAHRTIYEVMLELANRPIPADFITICDVLERRSKLDEVGGASYITSLINQVPTSGNAVYYGRIVERTAILRRLIEAAGQIAAMAYEDPEVDVTEVVDRAEHLIFEIGQRANALGSEASLAELVTEFMNDLDRLAERRGTIVGVPSGFTELDRLTGGFQRSDLIVLASRPSVGKCLTARTLIDDPATGERLIIEECVQRRLSHVYGVSEEGVIRPTPVADWIDSGIQPCYRVQTRSGRSVEVTGHHPFLTVRGWIPLHDLAVGQCIAVPTSVPAFGTDESWPVELVRLLAYFIAEGGLMASSPRFTNTDPVIIGDFKQIIATHFPICTVRQERITYAVAQPSSAVRARGGSSLSPNPLSQWLRDLGLMGKRAQEKSLPSCVWTWSRRYLAEFVRALMSCDGCIYAVDGYPRLEFTVASRQLAADLHHAFIRFGLRAKFSRTSAGAWRVEITSPESVKRYQEEIGWIGEKSERFLGYVYANPPRGSNNGHAPKETWEIVRAAAQRQGLSLTGLARKSGETMKQGKYPGYNAHTNRGIPRHRLSAYARILDHPDLQRCASSDVYWDEVVAIEPIGEHQVYDLTVPDGANFVAQDVFVHNTSLALSLAYNAAVHHGQRIGIFSLEMSQSQLVQRLVAIDTGIDTHRLRTGMIEEEDWDVIVRATATLSEAPIRIDGTSVLSPTQMRSRARRWVAEFEIGLIIVDYLQLMQPNDNTRQKRENRVLIVDEISRNLKLLARELNIPILVLAQLSRAVEARQVKVPQLSDLRECVTGDTRLVDATTGRWVSIREVSEGMQILGVDACQRIRPFAVERVWSTGVKPTYLLTTRTGRRVQATANHPFLTPQGWRCLEQLQAGDVIATALRLPGHGAEMEGRAERCRLLGYLVGDGTYQRHREVGFISMDVATMQDACEIVSCHFSDVVAREKPCHNSQAKQVAFITVYANGYGKPHGNPLREWLRSLGVFGQRDNTKHVPEYVFEAGVGGAREFLAGYLATDGCVKQRKDESHRGMWEIHFDTVSYQLAVDVQALLLRLGIVSSVQPSRFYSTSTYPIYRVAVALTAENLRRCTQIPARGKKGELLRHMGTALSRGQTNTNSGLFGLPKEVSTMVAERSRRRASVPRGMWTGRTWHDQGKRMNREVCQKWAREMEDTQLLDWATSDLLWESIRSIAPAGEAEVFDIAVPGCANFLANGIVAHNSGGIENNADIVMFIYRDELYNPETTRRNVADIIVAKHRNGPVGSVCLRYNPQTTRFRDMDDETVSPLAASPEEELELEVDEGNEN